MELNIITRGKKEILQIDDARMIFRNFEGRESKFNRKGDRNFAVVIPTEEMKNELIDRGYNVKIRPPRNEDEEPFMYLPVKVKYNENGPNPVVVVRSGNAVIELDEDTVGQIDDIEIIGADMDIKGSPWDINGKTGKSAYLQELHVEQKMSRFAGRYDD